MKREMQAWRATCQRGFTLIEMLIVMVLLSLLMLAMVSVLRTVGQTQERIDARFDSSDEYRVAMDFLRTTLSRVSQRRSETVGVQANASQYMFVAAPDSITWVGVMPARFGAGGRYFFHLAVEPVGTGSGLVLRFIPWNGSAILPPDWGGAEARVLAFGARRLTVLYENRQVEPPELTPDWAFPARIPDAVVLTVVTDTVVWPVMVVPLRRFPVSNSANTFSFGGGGG